MEDHGAGERRERRGRLVARVAAVDHDGQAELVGERELARRRATRAHGACGAVVAVETRLADRDDARVAEQLASSSTPAGLGRRRLVRVDPERGDDALVGVGDRERAAARLDARADRDHARHADRAGALEQLAAAPSHPSRCAWVSITPPARARRRAGRAASAASIPCAARVRP